MGGCGYRCMLDGVHLLVFVRMYLYVSVCSCMCVYAFPSHEHCLKYSSFHMTHICVKIDVRYCVYNV